MSFKKLLVLTIFCFFFTLIIHSEQVHASDPEIRIYIDAKQIFIPVDEPKPINKDNRVFIPIRFPLEYFKAEINWIQEKNMVEIIHQKTIQMTINEKQYYINEKEEVMDVAPFIHQSRTFVPIRFLSEAMGFEVRWQVVENIGIVHIFIDNLDEIIINNSLAYIEKSIKNDLGIIDQLTPEIEVKLKSYSTNMVEGTSWGAVSDEWFEEDMQVIQKTLGDNFITKKELAYRDIIKGNVYRGMLNRKELVQVYVNVDEVSCKLEYHGYTLLE